MRFGESFLEGANPKNRMDVLKNNKEEDLPNYINFGLRIRNILKEKIEKEGWPDLPKQEKINVAEDIFELAKNEVNETWELSVQNLIEESLDDWKKDLKVDNPEHKSALDLLNNSEELSKSLSLHQFGVLESLRTVNPEAWRSLVIASSERQLASISLLEHWLKTGDKENLHSICDKIGLNEGELKLFVDTAGILGKYIDHAYVKQIELADLPGGSLETKLGEEDGAQYIYDLYKDPKSEDIDIKTYTEIFPYEWDKIKSRFELLSLRTEIASESGKIPESYSLFANYLKKIAEVYSSSNVKPEVLDKEWSDLYRLEKEVDDTECPIMVIPQGCSSATGEAGKIDVEIRLGLKTKETREQEKGFNEFTKIAQSLLDKNKNSLKKDYKIPQVNLNYQPWAFGPNLYWMTRGESTETQILSHTNAVSEVAVAKEIPLLNKVFKAEKIEEKGYSKASITETVLHETGHSVLDSTDKIIVKRIGTSLEAGALEELKAETIGMKILLEAYETGKLPNDINMRSQLLAKLGTNLDYLKNKSDKKSSSGEPYYLCGSAIISGLLEKELITKNGSGYEVGETNDCIKEIVNIGDSILAIYTNNETKPVDVKNYINGLRKKGQSPQIKDFVQELK